VLPPLGSRLPDMRKYGCARACGSKPTTRAPSASASSEK
jgi:hypothetical protein